MTRHRETARNLTLADNRVTLCGPADLADALPYLLGYHPDDSLVLIGLHGASGRIGGRIRTGIPRERDSWADAARQLAACLAEGSEARGRRPDAAVVYLCQDAPPGRATATRELLRPLAQLLRTACGALDIPVYEALFLSGSRFWSYVCPDSGCCPEEGGELPRAGTSPMAAAAACAGIRVQGSLRRMEGRLAPLSGPAAALQSRALDEAASALVPRMLGTDVEAAAVRTETMELAGRLLTRFRKSAGPSPAPSAGGERTAASRPSDGAVVRKKASPGSSVPAAPAHDADVRDDARDDALLTHPEAARLVLGLQDRLTRDRAAEWMEGEAAPPALRLWRALARRCVAAYREHAAAPLTLAGWVAWSTGDEAGARVALGRALTADPDYVFAGLLHQACNEGLDPEPLRRCMRQQQAARGL